MAHVPTTGLFSHGRRLRQRIWMGVLALTALSAPICYVHNQLTPAQELPPLSRKVAAMCRAMSGSCDSVSVPRHYAETVSLSHSRHRVRRIQSVTCVADGRHFVMLYNETTGRLCCVFGENRTTGRERATILTPDAALDAALVRLRQLELLPRGARFALDGAPKAIRLQSAWQINWLVKRSGGAAPCRLKMVLDSAGGYPLHIADMYEMKQFAPQ